jgi:hypothetical protein
VQESLDNHAIIQVAVINSIAAKREHALCRVGLPLLHSDFGLLGNQLARFDEAFA